MKRRRQSLDHKPTTYADSRAEQNDFEQLVREEGDWQAAVEDEAKGKKPKHDPPPISSSA